jgi:dihydroorotate dehydrogenase (NAD+) catalytic subunit
VNLAVNLAPHRPGGFSLLNPVMTASGTWGYGTEDVPAYDYQRLGAVVCKGTTWEPREGNPQVRLAETPSGMLNAIGLQNIGVAALIRDKAPIWAGWRVPVIVNIAGESVEEYARLAGALNGVPGVAALEVNISCPNIASGGLEFGTDPGSAAAVTAAVRAATTLPVIVKLTPNVSDIATLARAVAGAGADAISLINTLRGLAIDVPRRRPLLANIRGGLSGPAIKPVALYMVWEVAGAVDIPVIGIGGIATTRDALEFLLAGASAVQVGSASFAHPQAPLAVLEGLERYLTEHHLNDIREIIGAARPRSQ